MTLGEIPRADLVSELAARVQGGPPLLVTGPPGAGKSTLLALVARRLAAEGWIPVSLDLFAAVGSPGDFVDSALGALDAEHFAALLPGALEARRRLELGRAGDAGAVDAILRLWSGLDTAGAAPVALLLDEVGEIRSLAYFAGLREAGRALAAALGRRRRGTLLACSAPSGLGEAWAGFERYPVPPLSATDLAPAVSGSGWNPAAVCAVSLGWPRYVRALVESASHGEGLAEVWVREMRRGGRLETACRSTYESLLLRSRGYGMSKAVLRAVACDEGANLTAVVRKLGRTPGAVGDYLSWLIGVDALRREKKRYFFSDGLVADWVRLHGRGCAVSDAQLRHVLETRLAGVPAPTGDDDATLAAPPRTASARRDTLMEID